MDVVIVGAGVGGLCTALMLHEQGIKPRIFEQAAEVRELGVGINILPHAVKPLAALGLLDRLDEIAVRTKELRYLTKFGQTVWTEQRGLHAGHEVPQFSIHRGKLQKLLHDAVVERLGRESVQFGCKLSTFIQDEGGVSSHFVNSVDGGSSRTVRSEILICADGIHSAARQVFYPDQGPPSWQGVVMWRGSAEWPVWEDGETMVIAGGLGGKLVLYPITPAKGGTQLMNWVVNVRVADGAVSPPPENNWSKTVSLAKVLPHARRFEVDGIDIEALIRSSGPIYEYPMADRDPLPRWSHGRVTLLGDAAHPMYPVGSNGAAQAILDAQFLVAALVAAEHPREALHVYDRERLPATAEIVKLNRKGGPEKVIDEVEKICPGKFESIDDILEFKHREMIVKGYAGKAGFAVK